MNVKTHLLKVLEDQLTTAHSKRIGLAVSGGGDSMALLSLMAELAPKLDITPVVITIDHGLRSEARDELRVVERLCAQLDIEHHYEIWSQWDGTGNLQAAARKARYDLICDWAFANDIEMVALAHTANDQAETVVMRLARGAGVDGLSSMVVRRVHRGLTWMRPLLEIERATLRDYLRGENISWAEDPSNNDDHFQRVRVRKALEILHSLGVTVHSLTSVAHNMRKARDALSWQAFIAAHEIAQVEMGAVRLDARRFSTLPDEIARRLVINAVIWMSSGQYPPRRHSVDQAMRAIHNGNTTTLNGVQTQRLGDQIWLFREYNAVKNMTAEIGEAWDDRWYIDGDDDTDMQIRALGPDGLNQIADWRSDSLPQAAIMSIPAVFSGGQLVAAPVLQSNEIWSAEISHNKDTFCATFLSH